MFVAALAWNAYCRTFEIDWARQGVNYAFLLYDWDSIEVFGLSTITYAVRRKGRSENVTLLGEPVEWNQGPYETIGRAQTKESDYRGTL